jgi:hypothetical protein
MKHKKYLIETKLQHMYYSGKQEVKMSSNLNFPSGIEEQKYEPEQIFTMRDVLHFENTHRSLIDGIRFDAHTNDTRRILSHLTAGTEKENLAVNLAVAKHAPKNDKAKEYAIQHLCDFVETAFLGSSTKDPLPKDQRDEFITTLAEYLPLKEPAYKNLYYRVLANEEAADMCFEMTQTRSHE